MLHGSNKSERLVMMNCDDERRSSGRVCEDTPIMVQKNGAGNHPLRRKSNQCKLKAANIDNAKVVIFF